MACYCFSPAQPFIFNPTVQHVPVVITHAVGQLYLPCLALTPWQNHQYHCPRFPVQCPNQCGTPNIAREDLANHVKDNCGSALVLCPFKDAGCKHRVRRSCFASVNAAANPPLYLHACFH